MKSISPIIATILIVVMTVAIAGIFYTYNSGRINYSNISSNLTSGTSTNITSISLEYTQITTNISLGYIPIIIYNTQNIPTPSPFQQDIAICNGSINIGNNFAYVNNVTLFNQINSNGSNVLFYNPNNNQLFYYSWYEGQLNYNGVTCDVWWVNIPNGIPANSNITIYMYVGNSSSDYYPLIYPYIGTNEQVIGNMQYDNGQDVFIAYGYFNNTFDEWNGYVIYGSYSPTATLNGIEMISNQGGEGTYILPPNNGNIPKIPLIVEEAWYYPSSNADANVIALFGNTNNQVYVVNIGGADGGRTPASNLSTFVQFEYGLEIILLILK
jgi:archaeal flagellin N-terminal-like domain